MAAYAALLSLNFIINQIKQHPSPPISLDQQQLHSLTQNLSFLQNFLEDHSNEEDELVSRIAYAAYAAEDVIESHIVDQILARSTSHGENISSVDFYQGLEKVIQDMDLIKIEVMKIVKVKKMGAQLHHQLMISTNSSVSIGPVRRLSRMQNNTIVDFGDIIIDVMDQLTRNDCNLKIIPIVGMGGIGKTTLARKIYEHPLIVQHFHFLAWVTISQEYSVSQILSQVLSEELRDGQVHEIGERVHKKLYGRRYLIVMDDIWSIEAWDKVKSFFPNNNNGSRIVITTRLSNLAFQLSGSHDFKMKFLNEDKSWDLLSKIVFGKEGCPIELENIGKEIARNCRGLPLSIVVIGGLLKKSIMTRDYWEYTLRNMSSLINLENKEHCLEILGSSYKELPIHLKPCFLYIGVFPEDYKINVSNLVKLCVAEGLLKPIENKTLEEVAKEYINELIDRNLILVHELSCNGEAKFCKIHDLLRDMCLREAKRHRFFCVLREGVNKIPEDINMERRICIHDNTAREVLPQFIDVAASESLIRSLILFVGGSIILPPPSLTCRLLRVLSCFGDNRKYEGLGYAECLFQQANLRYLSLEILEDYSYRWNHTSWYLLWNLQTLDVTNYQLMSTIAIAPFEIWKMYHLRHLKLPSIQLPNPPSGEDEFVLENLQTLSGILNFTCSEEVVKRIPNIKKLKLFYDGDRVKEEGLHSFCLNNLCRLRNLKSLNLHLKTGPVRIQNLVSLPVSLKRLYLSNTRFLWEDITTKIGSLPRLQVLYLDYNSCVGFEWQTFQGQFHSLKFLLMNWIDLKCWMTDNTHFPCLERLVLRRLDNLEEIPQSIGDIPTLQLIKLINCPNSVNVSAERIKEEQLSYGNEDLQLLIER